MTKISTELRKKLMMLLVVVMALTTTFALAGCGGKDKEATNNDQAAQTTTEEKDDYKDVMKATVGYWGGGVCEMPVYIAYEKGYFEKYGLDVDLFTITEDLAVSMANGDMDAVMTTIGDFAAIYNGNPLTLVEPLHSGCHSVWVKGDSGIKSLADLKGKTIGVASYGNPGYPSMVYYLQKAGISVDDVNIVVYSNTTLQDALDAGEIDAAEGYDPFAFGAELNGDKIIWSLNEIEECCCYLGVSNDVMENNPKMAKRLALAFADACDYIQDNREDAVNFAYEKGYLTGELEAQMNAIKTYNYGSHDKEWFNNSIHNIWLMHEGIGNIPDAPKDKKELEDFVNNLTKEHTKFLLDE